MNTWIKVALTQLGWKFPRKGAIHLDEYDKKRLKNAGITEYQMIKTFRVGEEESPLKFVWAHGAWKITIVLRENPNKQGDYQLISCWKGKNWETWY